MSMEAYDMSKAENLTLQEIFENVNGAELKEKKGKSFHFKMHLTREMLAAPIESLDLSVRSYNVLRRAGYDTVGSLTDAIAGGVSLGKIRNCGVKSVREIMEKLFLFQYESLDSRQKEAYLKETIKLNKERGRC